MTEKRLHYHLSGTKTGKKIKVKTEKINKLLIDIPTSNITEVDELIYAGAKFVCAKIGVSLKKSTWNIKPAWEMRLER